VNKNKRIFLIFQLTREIWDYHLSFPWSWIGKRAENMMLRLSKRDVTITESQSTKNDLIKAGFHKDLIHVIPVGLPHRESVSFGDGDSKMPNPTFIYVGRYAKYKGIDNAISAFGMAKKVYPLAKLWLVGKADAQYIKEVLNPLCDSMGLSMGTEDDCDVVIKGFVSDDEKTRLQSMAHALLFPSVREGWGMIVTEAALEGTPSIVFNSPGCCDAVDYGRAGYMCQVNTNEELARLMILTQTDTEKYEAKRQAAYQFSQAFSWEKTTAAFVKLVKDLRMDNKKGK
jgi:glycosyltransferase involved in cell wall biosynthesis